MATEKRLIEANARIEEIRKAYCANCDNYDGVRCRACWVDDGIGFLEDAPTVDAVEVVHGRWEKDGTCSNCKGLNPTYRANKWSDQFSDFPGHFYHLTYCPHCGAKMDGGTQDGN